MDIVVYIKKEEERAAVTAVVEEKYTLNHSVNELEELFSLAAADLIDVLIVDLAEIDELFIERLKNRVHYVIIVSKNATAQELKKALPLNVKDFLDLPLVETELQKALKNAEDYIQANGLHSRHAAKVIALISSKGGVGKSVLAVNLAALLQKEHGKKVLLIDPLPRFGSLDILLDLKSEKSLEYISDEPEDSDNFWKDINDNLIVHYSGVNLLTAGEKAEDYLEIDKFKRILKAVKDKYDYIIVDTESYFNEFNLAILELAEIIFYVTAFDIPSIKNLNAGLAAIKSLYFSLDKIKIILNRYDRNNEITIPELEKYINSKIAGVIPEDLAVVKNSINRGVPFVLENIDNNFLRESIRKIAAVSCGKAGSEDLTEVIEKQKNNNSWLNGLMNMFREA